NHTQRRAVLHAYTMNKKQARKQAKRMISGIVGYAEICRRTREDPLKRCLERFTPQLMELMEHSSDDESSEEEERHSRKRRRTGGLLGKIEARLKECEEKLAGQPYEESLERRV